MGVFLVSKKKILNYLYQLSIVVAGIVITFSVSARIQKINERQELKEYLELIKDELESDLYGLQMAKAEHLKEYRIVGVFEKIKRVYGSIVPYYVHIVPEDSLLKYQNFPLNTRNFFYKDDALETLKNSGCLRCMGNKELVAHIFESYRRLEGAKEDNNTFFRDKSQAILSESERFAQNYNSVYELEVMTSSKMAVFVCNTGYLEGLLRDFEATEFWLKKTVRELKAELEK